MNHSIQTLKLKYKPKLEKYKKYDKALNRILWILNRLQDKEYVKVSELAQEHWIKSQCLPNNIISDKNSVAEILCAKFINFLVYFNFFV